MVGYGFLEPGMMVRIHPSQPVMWQYCKKYKMISRVFLFVFSLVFLLAYFGFQQYIYAQNQETISAKASLLLSPSAETILVDSSFDVLIILDTQGNGINTVELNLKFPPDKLTIVRPSAGKSFFSIWLEAPTHSNTKGTAKFMGGIPEGITTESGLVTKITFKAKTTGRAIVEVLPSSKVLAADGLGTNILSEFGRGIYTINPRPPEGVRVFSKTHPSGDRWYNNNSPILMWEKDLGITDFSFELDNKPLTIPDNISDTEDTITSYEDLPDGVWFFHIKAKEEGIWGTATHFPLYTDTTPPLPFKPKIEILTAAVIDRALISFSTTDTLSGVDHYEVGVIDKTKSPLESPSFVEAQSPYQLPAFISGNLRVIARAIDRAGNVRDEFADVYVPLSLRTILITALGIIVLLAILYYQFGNKINNRLNGASRFLKNKLSRS